MKGHKETDGAKQSNCTRTEQKSRAPKRYEGYSKDVHLRVCSMYCILHLLAICRITSRLINHKQILLQEQIYFGMHCPSRPGDINRLMGAEFEALSYLRGVYSKRFR